MSASIGRKVSVLLSGSVAAQLLPVLAAPLLTRLYTPESFGKFGIFTAAATILASFANLKFDHAVLLSKKHATASHLLLVSFLVSATIAMLFAALALLVPAGWWKTVGFPTETYLLMCLPVAFLMQSVLQAISSMMFRHEQFSSVAKSRVIQALATTSMCLLCGISIPAGGALVASTLIGQVAGLTALILLRKRQRLLPVTFKGKLLFAAAVRYRRFPMFTTPSDFLNALGANLPMLFVGALYGTTAAGALTMAQRTLGTPLMLVGSAFSDAYRQSAARSVSTEGNYWSVAVRTLRTLGLMAIPAIVVSLLFAPQLFELVFGAKWALTGAMVQVLCVAYFLRFVFSPLSYNYYLAERHSEDLLLQCMSFGLTVVTFLATKSAGFHLLDTLVVYSAICACIYLFYGLRSMYFAWTSMSNQQVAANTAVVR